MRNKNVTVSIEEAQEIILDSVTPLSCESISIMEASNRVLYEDIVSDMMVPPADDSAMDGYAVIADNTHGASKTNPVRLHVIGEVQAGGSIVGKRVSKGSAIRIMTGAAIPEGADSVIQFEDTEETAGYVNIFRETTKYENYRFAGENIKKGDSVLHKGDRLSSADVGILASLNYNTVKVYKQPTVSIISTGNELADIGEEIQIGQIRNVNAYTLYSEVKKYNALPDYLGIAKDTLKDTKEMFLKALKSDVVISTGGVSMGRYDFVKEIYSDLNIEIQFAWVNVKPGRPWAFGKKGNKLIFGLPGNPVSTLTSFIQFVRPALLRLMGATRIKKPIINAVLEEDITKQSGKVHLLRGFFTIKNNEFHVSTTGNQNSSVLRSMSDANCLIVIPENTTEVRAGERVAIQLIDHDEIE
ncbi:MAG: Molybdopterin molybdenumtransferase [Syntrophorhabdus sp. PtaU1.Bin153]|nr:MAG: Molybdopterin molybdenumtransferase [Syntrophorhabdus sp. PtaU1.Bin153]